ncbi:MAG: tetratricopeptide repeat protein [Spirochaetales bacterium]|nr:tetratricopeptide repeat protein [Spirochaetales bacterium]
MEKLLLVFSVLVALFSSCSDADTYVNVTSGNFRFSQGEYEKANIDYLHALAKNRHAGIISYNLGNVYYALGESAAAQEEWLKAGDTDNEQLMFNIVFNLGVLQYDLGEYEKAYGNFKKALLINPQDIDAKKNLELSLQKMHGKGITGNDAVSDEAKDQLKPDDDEIRRILEFVQRKEEGWLSSGDDQNAQSGVQDW